MAQLLRTYTRHIAFTLNMSNCQLLVWYSCMYFLGLDFKIHLLTCWKYHTSGIMEELYQILRNKVAQTLQGFWGVTVCHKCTQNFSQTLTLSHEYDLYSYVCTSLPLGPMLYNFLSMSHTQCRKAHLIFYCCSITFMLCTSVHVHMYM